MLEIKWVDGWYDSPDDVPKGMLGEMVEVVPTPVVPLAALTEVVEGLKDRPKKERLECVVWDTGYLAALDDLLVQLEAHGKEG